MPASRRRPWWQRLVFLAWRTVMVLGLLVALAMLGFRVRSGFRETEERRVPERSGAFVRTELGEIRYLERGAPTGRPVVFIGGTMAPSDTFVPLMDALCDARLRCLALDLPPFGYSERPAEGEYGRARQATRIGAFIRALGLQGAVLVGHSFGAGPTVEAAMAQPGQVATFALLAGALGLGAEPPPAVVRASLSVGPLRTQLSAATLANPWAIRRSLHAFMANDAVVTDALVARFADPLRVKGTAAASGQWLRTALLADERSSRSAQPSSYQRYAPPVLLVWGDHDPATPLAQGQELARLLPHATLVVVPGVGHFPHLEAQPRVVEALRAFLLPPEP